MTALPWWASSVVYQIYPRSFCDTTGNGIGDLEGVRRHLDHLQWLGVDALWLSPVFASPMADYGYDVSDYCDIDPLFGDLATLDRLVEEAHDRRLKVLLDWVPNHTSDQHPWFVEARASRHDPKRDWYVWRDPAPDGGPPNNWVAAFPPDTPAWTLDDTTGQYYLHLFLSEQPDLNWDNPEVEAAMHDTLRFWLDRGVDGFRADVVHCIGKDPALADLDDDLAAITPVALNDWSSTHDRLRRIRTLLDSYPGDRMMVGEITLATSQIATYYGEEDELHLVFNFTPMFVPWAAEPWRKRLERVGEELDGRAAWPTWVLSNHDNPRHRTRYGSDSQARAAAVLLLTLRGTPFLYAGEELGLDDAEVPPDRVLDPGGRDGCRAPLPWDDNPGHGWAGDPWLPWPPEPDEHSATRQRADDGSFLHLYHRILEVRRGSPAIHGGSFELLDGPDDVLAYRRSVLDDEVLVLVNFSDQARSTDFRGELLVSSTRPGGGSASGATFDRDLEGHEAVVLHVTAPSLC